MPVYIAFFRAINVGGKNPLPMKSLVSLLEGLGARTVKTYIQSGNAVFQSAEKDPARLSRQLATAVKQHHGFEPRVLVLDLATLRKAQAGNPFPEAEADPQSLHLGFLAAQPQQPDIAKLSGLKLDSERFHLGDGVFYLHAPQGVGRSKLAASAEKLLGVPMTDRNWRTVCKVAELAQDGML